jgi:hypothetical protein
LTKEERVEVVCRLLGRFKDDILEYGAQSEIARERGINQSTVSRLWKLASKHLVNNRIRDWGVLGTQNHLRHCFPTYPPQLLREAIEEIPVSLRQSVRSLAGQLKVAPTTLTRYSESYGLYNRKNCTAKPVIRLENRTKRVLFAIDQIDYQHGHYYKDFYDTIFIDEKWFRCSKSTFHYYMTNNEDIPEHHAISKNKIEKVMFLCAVGRPRRDMHTGKSFDGKIGIWPITKLQRAKRDSKNRKKGTLEVKDVSVNGKVYMKYSLNYVLPAIAKNAPLSMLQKTIYLQQDNASAHLCVHKNSRKIREKCKELKINVVPVFQPPNSPDTNILNLCFFNSLQTNCFLTSIRNNKAELIAHVKNNLGNMIRRSLIEHS